MIICLEKNYCERIVNISSTNTFLGHKMARSLIPRFCSWGRFESAMWAALLVFIQKTEMKPEIKLYMMNSNILLCEYVKIWNTLGTSYWVIANQGFFSFGRFKLPATRSICLLTSTQLIFMLNKWMRSNHSYMQNYQNLSL